MARNKLTDLNNHLFEMLERLNDDELKGEALTNEVKRAKAIADVASQVVKNAEITLRAVHMVQTGDLRVKELPETFGIKE